MDTAAIKKKLGYAVIDQLVKPGMKLGLGTGTTAINCVYRLNELLDGGQLTDIKVVATSFQTESECQRLGIPTYQLNDGAINGKLDLAIDGADEVDPDFNVTKGGGGAHLLEKIVAYAADEFAVIVDESKLVKGLGVSFAVPLEVIPAARVSVMNALSQYDAKGEVRQATRKIGPVITESGNIIIDVTFNNAIEKPEEMELLLNSLPGVVENGLFTGWVKHVFVGYKDGRVDSL